MEQEQIASLELLNEAQREVVCAAERHVLVLAGAGSGKTRALTTRMDYLIREQGVSPGSILAVTFTNKAAGEMRARIEEMQQAPVYDLWVGTFHGLAHRLLRMHYREARLPEAFQILDSDDQQRLIKRIHKNLALDEEKWAPRQSQSFINHCKEEGLRAGKVPRDSYFHETMAQVYEAYEKLCDANGLVDFAELLLRSLELFTTHSDILAHYAARFQHLLIDEFQDTNNIQYQWIKTLACRDNYVMAVGDDDQSIYSWRGAKIENLYRFQKDYANTRLIRMEQNYRSTQTILDAANAVIGHNENRLGKTLWTESGTGAPIAIYAAFNERDEAGFVVSTIKSWLQQGSRHQDIAILYRSNAQSRVLEEALLEGRIPYRVFGGQKFFERAEVKDGLGYLRLMINHHDDVAFERIINQPTRGIGQATLTVLRETARSDGISLWQAAERTISAIALSARALQALQNFMRLIENMLETTQSMVLEEQVQQVLHLSGLHEFYRMDKTEKGLSRVENLDELVNAAAQFECEDEEEDAAKLGALSAFLAQVALDAGDTEAQAHQDSVSLMTLHAAKGLEFPIVFVCGLEENLFPHHMSIESAAGLEEERRLCYVGMTRAMKKLYLTYSESRQLHGRTHLHEPSRFLAEIPNNLTESVRATPKVKPTLAYAKHFPGFAPKRVEPHRSSAIAAPASNGVKLGQRVKHPKFGVGIIIQYEGEGDHLRVQVKFDQAGSKWLIASFAHLQPC